MSFWFNYDTLNTIEVNGCLSIFTFGGEAQLSAHYSSVFFIPQIVANCPPLSLIAELHSSCVVFVSSSQSDVPIHATLNSFFKKKTHNVTVFALI